MCPHGKAWFRACSGAAQCCSSAPMLMPQRPQVRVEGGQESATQQLWPPGEVLLAEAGSRKRSPSQQARHVEGAQPRGHHKTSGFRDFLYSQDETIKNKLLSGNVQQRSWSRACPQCWGPAGSGGSAVGTQLLVFDSSGKQSDQLAVNSHLQLGAAQHLPITVPGARGHHAAV